jgi:hypothetical protein
MKGKKKKVMFMLMLLSLPLSYPLGLLMTISVGHAFDNVSSETLFEYEEGRFSRSSLRS